EPHNLQLYPRAEAIWRTLYALSLTPHNDLTPGGATSAAATETALARAASPDELLNRGIALQAQGQHTEALPLFHRATELAPDLAAAWFHLGHGFNQLGRSAEALEALERAVTLDAGLALAWAS